MPAPHPRLLVNLTSARTGGGLTFGISQLQALLPMWPAGRITVLSAPWNDDALSSVLGGAVRLVPVRSAAHRFLWEQTRLPAIARAYDVLYCPANYAPFWGRTPRVLTQQNHNYVGYGRRLAHNRGPGSVARAGLSIVSMRRADHVVAISESLAVAMREDRLLRTLMDRVTVVLSGAPAWPGPSRVPATGMPAAPYVLSVANDSPHKRLPDVVAAWARTTTEAELVLVGRTRRETQLQLVELAGHRSDRLVFVGPVEDRRELRAFYESAALAVSGSELEAFPLVPHEAGSVGCPLVLSDIAPHREVARDRARYVPVGEVGLLGDAIDEVLTHPPSREPWRWDRSWEDNARELSELLRGVSR